MNPGVMAPGTPPGIAPGIAPGVPPAIAPGIDKAPLGRAGAGAAPEGAPG